MHTTLTIPALIAASIVAGGARDASAQRPRAPDSDQTVQVQRGSRLVIDNFAGDVVVHGWDRDSLRVQARHPSRTRVNVRQSPTGFRVSASGEHGPQGSVDYDIMAPSWMPVRVDGHFNFVTVEGVQAEISVESTRGDTVIKGGNGVTVKSIQGNITVDKATGKINLSSVSEGIAISGSSGEIIVETVSGSIVLGDMKASALEAGTISGNITYAGTVANQGRYRLTSHSGSLTVEVPESSNATFAVRTYTGGFNSSLPVKSDGDAREVQRGRRVIFTLGTGSAEFELESFSGGIRLRKPGTAAATTRSKDADKEKNKDRHKDER